MKPDIAPVLKRLSDLLSGQLAATLDASFEGQQALRIAPLLSSAALEIDRAAARRVEENCALRQLFAQAAVLLQGSPLADDLAALPAEDSDLRVHALEASNQRLRHLLTRLHAWCEERLGQPGVAELNQAIWQELRLGTHRRALPCDRY